MKKKVAFYYDIVFLGGVEHAILTLLKKLYKDYEIFVIYGDETSNEDMLKRYSAYSTVMPLRVADIDVDSCICGSKIDVDIFTKKVRAKKYYAWIHAIMFQTYENVSYSSRYQNIMDKFICVSNSVREDILSVYPELENKCIVVKNYIDLLEIEKKANADIDIKVHKDSLNIITVARLSEEKGFHRIKALVDIFNKKNIKYTWYVLGAAYTKEAETKIKGLFSKNDNVIFLGYKENPYTYIKEMDYLALLSDIEAWGLVISEALALKIPCIVTEFKEAYSQINESNGIILPMSIITYKDYLGQICDRKFNIKNTNIIKARNREIMLEWKGIL